jgi:hypothetical protein
MAEFIHWFAEMLEWRGREARENAGTQWLIKNNPASHQRVEPVKGQAFEYNHDWDDLLNK